MFLKNFLGYSIIVLMIISCIGVIEYTSLCIKNANKLRFLAETSHNRIVSGYHLFKNAPYFKFYTYDGLQDGVEMIADSNGFFYTPTGTNGHRQYKDTFDIFLCGGSALMGSGQVNLYSRIYTYPSSLYHYEITVAGQLKKELEQMYPEVYFKIINTSLFTRTFHQSFLLYVTKLSVFKPDLIIQMDGFNDLSSFTTRDIYGYYESLWLDYYIDIRNIKRGFNSDFLSLLSYIRENAEPQSLNYKVYHPGFAEREEYEKRKIFLMQMGASFLNIVMHYSTILKEDNVPFIFTIQPMLHSSVNKELSEIEERFRKEVNFFQEAKLDRFMKKNKNTQSFSLKDEMLLLNYGWGDFICNDIESIVRKKGGEFIDFNKEAEVLDKNFELYTDFCHLTMDGNRFVAKVLAERISQMKLF